MKVLSFYIFLLFIVSLTGCVWDEGVLGDDYYWMPDYEAEDVGYYGSILYKSDNQNILSGIKICPDVINAKSNNTYIIVIQRPNKMVIEQMRVEGRIDRKKSYEYLYKNATNYYIINKKTDIIYGLLNKEEYLLKRKELNLSERFELSNK